MKKNIWQIITSGLCVVLLVVVVVQGKKFDELSQKLDSKVDNLRYGLQSEISNITNIVRSELEELDRIVLSNELKPFGINKDTKQLLANATVNLKEWYADTEVTLYMTIGDTEVPIEMTSDGAGMFSCIVELPCEVDAKHIIELAALVSGGGLTKKESLGAWGDISMLLPLRSDGGGWSGPMYKNGVMSSQFNISIVGQSGTSAEVINPEFWVYKNGEVVHPDLKYAENGDIIVSRIGKSAGKWCRYNGERVAISDCLYVIKDSKGEVYKNIKGTDFTHLVKGVATPYIAKADIIAWYTAQYECC